MCCRQLKMSYKENLKIQMMILKIIRISCKKSTGTMKSSNKNKKRNNNYTMMKFMRRMKIIICSKYKKNLYCIRYSNKYNQSQTINLSLVSMIIIIIATISLYYKYKKELIIKRHKMILIKCYNYQLKIHNICN